MHFEVFSYGHDWEELFAFIRWWIMSDGFSEDIKKGQEVKGGISVRSIDHTITVSEISTFRLLIEKGVTISDSPIRPLKENEMFINKGPAGKTGFDKAVGIVENWLSRVWDYDPYQIDPEKAMFEGMRFDMIGVGLYLVTNNDSDWKISISAGVVGIPK